MATASEYYEAELRRSVDPSWKRAGRFVGRLLLVVIGNTEWSADVDLVLLRKGTSLEVHRTRADNGDPELLLREVRKDLDRLSVDDFRAEWSLD